MMEKSKPRVIFLDDDEYRTALARKRLTLANKEGRYDAVFTKTAEETIAELKKEGHIMVLSLDHDLGGQVFVGTEREDCGMEVVRFIESNQSVINKIGRVDIHSWNIPAAEEMENRLQRLGLKVTRSPFQ